MSVLFTTLSVDWYNRFLCYAFFFNINFWGLHYVFVAAHELSLVAVTGGHSSMRSKGFLWRLLLL